MGGVCWKAVAAFALRVTIWMSGSRDQCSHNPLWSKMAILMFSSGYVPDSNLAEKNSLYTVLCVIPHQTKLWDLPLQICSDIWVVYWKEMLFCVWTANSLKKNLVQIHLVARDAGDHRSQFDQPVCYGTSPGCAISIVYTPVLSFLRLLRASVSGWFAPCQVLCSDTPQCYNCAIVSSGILDTHRHGKSQVVPLLHSYPWHFTQ